MPEAVSNPARLFLRLAAVSFALLASCYLIYTSQERARPAVVLDEPPAGPVALETDLPADSAAGAPAASTPVLMPSSKVAVVDDPSLLQTPAASALDPAVDPPFLFGSKSLTLPPTMIETPPSEAPAFLPDSKAGPVAAPEFLPSSKVKVLAPLIPAPPPQPQSQSTFLPSSKVEVLPPLAPQTTSPKPERVFLPTSKSVRLRESPPPAPKPPEKPAPATPPKGS